MTVRSADQQARSRPVPAPPSAPVGWGFVALYALAYVGTILLFLAPLLVSLSLKVNALVGTERAPNSLSLVAGVRRNRIVTFEGGRGAYHQEVCARCAGPITALTVAGRRIDACPTCQT